MESQVVSPLPPSPLPIKLYQTSFVGTSLFSLEVAKQLLYITIKRTGVGYKKECVLYVVLVCSR